MTSSTTASEWTSADSARAQQIWDEYLRSHDVSQQQGQAVGIDPATGHVWFGRTALSEPSDARCNPTRRIRRPPRDLRAANGQLF